MGDAHFKQAMTAIMGHVNAGRSAQAEAALDQIWHRLTDEQKSRAGSVLYRDEDLGEILFGEDARQGYRDSFLGDAILGGIGSAGKLLSGTADLDSRIREWSRQLEAVRYENDLAELKAEYDKHVPLPEYGLSRSAQPENNGGTMDVRPELNTSENNVLKSKLDTGELSGKISFQMQSKHIEGTPQYEQYKNARLQKGDNPQSILTISREEAQELVEKYSGTGNVLISPSGQNTVKIVEFVTTDKVVGKYYADDKFVDTKRFGIYYSKRGAHIVPVREARK